MTLRFLLSAVASLVIAAAPATAEPSRNETLAVADRPVEVSVWDSASTPRGIVLFGHGYNSNPARYDALLTGWSQAGYQVYAPLAVDSRQHPDNAAYNPQTATLARIETLQMMRGYIAEAHPDTPVILAGHSFGSLMSLLGGGAGFIAGQLDGPPVAGVLAFSSAGALPQLLGANPYASLDVPMLMITGTNDTVPQFAPDWRAHRLPFDTSPAGDKYLAIVEEGDHSLVRMADPRDAATMPLLSRLFLDAYAGGDEMARAVLGKLDNSDRMRFERR